MGNRHRVSEEGFRPYRHLAIRVLARALLDVLNPRGSAQDRESARVFLDRSSMLGHWCRVAALDPTAVAALAQGIAGNAAACARLRVAPALLGQARRAAESS